MVEMGKDKSQVFTNDVPAVFVMEDKAISVALNTIEHSRVRLSRKN